MYCEIFRRAKTIYRIDSKNFGSISTITFSS